MFNFVEGAGVAARRGVRRDESPIGTVVERFGPITFRAKTMLITSKASARMKPLTVVYKGGAP